MIKDAMTMLRMELMKQPLLSVFFTTESWREALIPPLIDAGYLSPAYTMETAAGSCIVHDITDKARAELAQGWFTRRREDAEGQSHVQRLRFHLLRLG